MILLNIHALIIHLFIRNYVDLLLILKSQKKIYQKIIFFVET